MKPILFFALCALCLLASGGQAHAFRIADGVYIFDKLNDFNICQNESYGGEYCLDALDRWLAENPGDRLQAAKIVRGRMNSAVALPYFYDAMDHEDWSCEDEDMSLAVESALGLPADATETIAKTQEIAFDVCFSQMQPVLMDLRSDDNAFPHICKGLADRGLLTSYQNKKCMRDLATGKE